MLQRMNFPSALPVCPCQGGDLAGQLQLETAGLAGGAAEGVEGVSAAALAGKKAGHSMKRFVVIAALAAVVGALAAIPEADAASKKASASGSQRRGGYSYNQADSINTYGDSRSKYGGASVYRDPQLDKQTTAGPFDHGFFFDSAIGAHGGDSPYMN